MRTHRIEIGMRIPRSHVANPSWQENPLAESRGLDLDLERGALTSFAEDHQVPARMAAGQAPENVDQGGEILFLTQTADTQQDAAAGTAA
jgi:hypothetical protein